MKATQFIKDHGLERARGVLAKDQFAADICLITPSGKLIYYKEVKGSFPEVTDFAKVELTAEDYFMFELSILKRLVESVDLVEKLGGIKKAKEMLVLFEDRKDRSDNYMPLFRAVQDYESIYGEGNE